MARPAHLAASIIELLQTHHLLGANELLQLLSQSESTTYNKTSVYRALEKLESEGLICSQSLTEGEARYELRARHHDHLVCSRCGRIEKVDCQLHLPTALNGFILDHHHLTIFGICPKCRQLP